MQMSYEYGSYGVHTYGGLYSEKGVSTDFPLVGSDVKPTSEKCGIFSKNKFCDNVHFHEGKPVPVGVKGQGTMDGLIPKGSVLVFVHAFRCTNPLCPECCLHWAKLQTGRAMRRFEFFGSEVGVFSPLDNFEIRHVGVSVPHWCYGLSFSEMKRKSLDAVMAVGVEGGVAIYHPKRYNKISRSWYFSPHFHILGFVRDGWLRGDLVAEVNNITGFVVRNWGKRKSVYKTMMYQLSHCGVPSGRSPAVVWFGDCNSRFTKGLDSKKGEKRKVCPVCEEPLKRCVRSPEGEKKIFPYRQFEDTFVIDSVENWKVVPYPKRKLKYTCEEGDLYEEYERSFSS